MFDVYIMLCDEKTEGLIFRLLLSARCEYFYEESKGLLSVYESVEGECGRTCAREESY